MLNSKKIVCARGRIGSCIEGITSLVCSKAALTASIHAAFSF